VYILFIFTNVSEVRFFKSTFGNEPKIFYCTSGLDTREWQSWVRWFILLIRHQRLKYAASVSSQYVGILISVWGGLHIRSNGWLDPG